MYLEKVTQHFQLQQQACKHMDHNACKLIIIIHCAWKLVDSRVYTNTNKCDATYLSHDGSAHSQEWSEGQEEESETPILNKANDEATEEGGHPLNKQSYLVTNTIVDLVNVTVQSHDKK